MLERYLQRIGYRGEVAPTADVLRELHRQHLLTVPFENLDVHLGRPIAAAAETFFNTNYVFNTTQAQVGGFQARIDNFDEGHVMFTVVNRLTVNSFFYHVPNMLGFYDVGLKQRGGETPAMGMITQRFTWIENKPKDCP